MSEYELGSQGAEPAETGEVEDNTIRTRISLANGVDLEVREKFPTVSRYLNKAKENGQKVVSFSESKAKRFAVNPDHVVNVEELVR